MKKIDFQEIAAFIASDATLDVFPDILWPLDVKFPKAKVNWLAQELEQRYKLYKESPNEDSTDTEEFIPGTDPEDE